MSVSASSRALLVAVFQAERFGATRPRQHARELGESPPAYAMAAIADDCVHALDELRILEPFSREHGAFAARVAHVLRAARDRARDALSTRARSYRDTLRTLAQGSAAIACLRDDANANNDGELVVWCLRTLARREPLLAEAERALVWFDAHAGLLVRAGRVVRAIRATAHLRP